MSDRTRGRPEKHGAVDVIEVFMSRDDPFEPLTATEVADELDIVRKTASNKLNDAPDEILNTKKTGARSRVWWPNRQICYPHLSPLMFEQDAADVVARLTGDIEVAHGEEPEIPAVADTVIEALEIPGSGEVVKARRAAIRAIYQELVERQSATKQDLLGAVVGYAHEYKDDDSFWQNLIIARRVMHKLPGVLPPGEAGREYQFIGTGGTVGVTPN